jgi:hypothetical protein
VSAVTLLLVGLVVWLGVEAVALYFGAAPPPRPARERRARPVERRPDFVTPAVGGLEACLPAGWKVHPVPSRGLELQVHDADGLYRASVWVVPEVLEEAELRDAPAWLAEFLHSRGTAPELLSRLRRLHPGVTVVR